MNHKSEVLVKDHKHDDHLIKDSSKSSDRQSDTLDYDNKLMLIEKKENIKMIGLKDKENEDRLSDSKESDDDFLECESDYEFTNESDNQIFNNIYGSNLCKDSEILDEKISNLNAAKKLNVKNFMKSKSYHCLPSYYNGFGDGGQFGYIPKSYVPLDPELFSHANREGGYSSGFQGQFIDPELVQNRTIPSKSFLSRQKRKGSQDMSNVISQDQNENSASDSIYEDASDIPSEVNSELESRIIEFHEAKKSLSTSENGEINEDPTKQDSMSNMVYEPEDEIDELFDRVINCEYDPDFTFLPVALDPYVKISNKLIAKRTKRYGRQMLNSKGTKKSPGGSSAASSASSCSGECGNISTDHKDVDSKLKIKPIDNGSSLSQYVQDEPLAAKDGLILDESRGKQKHKPVDNERERLKAKEIDEYRQVLRLDTSIEPRIKFHDVQEYDSTDSEVEKQKEFARVLFEATKDDEREQYVDSDDEDLSPNIKSLKLSKKSGEEKVKSEKKSKKSKHKSDTESEDEKVSKTDKKSDKKSSKSSKHISEVDIEKDNGKVDKSEPEKGGKVDKSEVVEKPEKGDKNEKHKDKKPEKIKKVAWKSTDYDMIFNTLGECFSSGHIGHDTNPIVLNRKGFYTLFFRNSKYPYDSNIDFYLFRIGFKYSLVNEPKNQPLIIGI
ncbi:uncharacterized protein TA17005 [Theileria annulata]|uniref:Uncharacterized protein n=1 Tax=Theileria annulata TaxID=5874 RepID=Q4UIN9_THEAN|nr:uncharacterized protein TA17005 [Theileria annulata]CAI73050.1 hypothetical protein TA17005 [Theileria annulata]|eukprot:XP_953728.1 hypothetical protein TA17005 [Theileria annulata]